MPRALLSVTDKSGLAEFASGLARLGFEIVSTGGTARALREAGIEAIEAGDLTGYGELLDGRVKTLHPAIHAGLLADRRKEEHRKAIAAAGIEPIELVCVNLYRFEETVTGPHSFSEAIESIDIGGPAMIRAAAKNLENVTVVVDPSDYPAVLEALEKGVGVALRRSLAAKAFRHTAYYDAVIGRYLTETAQEEPYTEHYSIGLRRASEPLRYGENPHQRAARYIDPLSPERLVASEGPAKEMSYNNWLDASCAWELASDLPPHSCAIIKHGNPCGVGVASCPSESFRIAKASDPVSAFGGIVALHSELDEATLDALGEAGNFFEVVVSAAPGPGPLLERFRSGLGWRKSARFLHAVGNSRSRWPHLRAIVGGYLAQEPDTPQGEHGWTVATKRIPTESEMRALKLQWTIARHVKSNAITVGDERALFGVGAGQMNRVQSVRLALGQASERAKGAALASDAFFPFPDSIEEAARAGIAAIVQPGGSKKDDEVIAAANELGLSMVLTHTRHFRH